MKLENVPPQQPPVERQRNIIKTKTIGSAGSDIPERSATPEEKAKLESQAKSQNKSAFEEKADEVKAEMLDRMGKMRHLKYEVIDEAAIVQVSVINSEDGTIVRKVPPDKVVDFVERIRKHKKISGKDNFDMKL